MDTRRTEKYWFVGGERVGHGRARRRAVSAAAVGTTLVLAVVAAAAGILLALTQAGVRGVGFAWAAWTLVVAYCLGRLVYDALRGPSRRV